MSPICISILIWRSPFNNTRISRIHVFSVMASPRMMGLITSQDSISDSGISSNALSSPCNASAVLRETYSHLQDHMVPYLPPQLMPEILSRALSASAIPSDPAILSPALSPAPAILPHSLSPSSALSPFPGLFPGPFLSPVRFLSCFFP